MTKKRAPHPEVTILEELYVSIVRKTGSQARADEYLRLAMKILFFDDANIVSRYSKNPERFFNELIESLDRFPSQLEAMFKERDFDEGSITRLMFDPETLEWMRRERLLPKTKDLSKEAPPHPSESRQKPKGPPANADMDEIGPDRAFWQLCRRAGVHPLVEYLLPPEVVEDLEIQLNDVESLVTIRLLIAEEVFETICMDYIACTVDDENEEEDQHESEERFEAWSGQYLRCCRFLGGFIRNSETHAGSNAMLQYFGLSKENQQRLKKQLEAEGFVRLD